MYTNLKRYMSKTRPQGQGFTKRMTRQSSRFKLELDRLIVETLSPDEVLALNNDSSRIEALLSSGKHTRQVLSTLVKAMSRHLMEVHAVAFAISEKKPELLRLYLESGLRQDTFIRSDDFNAIYASVAWRSSECLRVCLEFNPKQSELHHAMKYAVRRCVDYLPMLVQAGAAITPPILGHAILADCLDSARILLESDAYNSNEVNIMPDGMRMIKLLRSHNLIPHLNLVDHFDNVTWLTETTVFRSTKLHFFEHHTESYVCKLLRNGGDPLAIDMSTTQAPSLIAQRLLEYDATMDVYARESPRPTPLSIAMAQPHLPNACLIIRSMQWNKEDHHKLFPAEMRARVRELVHVGALLSYQPRFATCQQAIADIWVSYIVPFAVRREV